MRACVCISERLIERERERKRKRGREKNADRCCRGNHLSPISSLTLSPQRLLVTIAAISHFADVLSLHLSVFFIFTLPRSPSLLCAQSHLPLDDGSSCRCTCRSVCTHVLVSTESLCAGQQSQFVLKFRTGSHCFASQPL